MTMRLTRRDLANRLIARKSGRAPAMPPPIAAATVPFEYHLLSRATFGRTPELTQTVTNLEYQFWLEQQLDHLSIEDTELEETIVSRIPPYANGAADTRMLTRAIYSRRQLAWRMTHFLNNHFSTFVGATNGISESNEDDRFFEHCFSDFATVLRISATSPAMIDFLDSGSNIAGNPNENYSRELLELHTMGVGTGYTEQDVAVIARVFTGWTRALYRPGGPGTPILDSRFVFRPARHDSGPKSISLGWSTPGFSGRNGVLEGLQLLDFLAAHPATATRFTEKLCRYFVSDNPPPGLLTRIRQLYVETQGNLRAMVYGIFTDPEFATPATCREKVHDGFEFLVNVVRRLEIPAANPRALLNASLSVGGVPHQNPVPTGYPESGPAWQGVGNLLPRWKFVDDLVHDAFAMVRVPWPALFGSPTPSTGAQWVANLLPRLVDTDVPPTTAGALAMFMDNRLTTLPSSPTPAQMLPHVRDLVSLILRVPEAQLM